MKILFLSQSRFIIKTFPVFQRIFLIGYLLTVQQFLFAGPPYLTDDPDPVPYRHWEFYISSQNVFNIRTKFTTGTLPHFEVNYGLIPNIQIHVEIPMNYNYPPHYMTYGYSNSEFGIKYRFVKETQNCPEIGIFPIIEIPTINNSEFSNGSLQVYLPIWIQKSWGKLTTYGGGGYWINQGADNKNWIYVGWMASTI